MGAGASRGSEYDPVNANAEAAATAESEEVKRLKEELSRRDKTIAVLRKKSVAVPAAKPPEKTGGSNKPPLKHQKTRRGEISAEVRAAEEMTKLHVEYYDKSDEQAALIRETVDESILFANLKRAEKQEIVKAFHKQEFAAGTDVVVQGEGGQKFYVVESGTLQVWVADALTEERNMTGTVERGGSFGELALMYNTARAATVTTATPCTLWIITRDEYLTIHKKQEMELKQMYETFMTKVPGMQSLSRSELSKLVHALQEVTYAEGDAIIREGEIGNHFFVIVSGTAEYSKKSEGVVGTATQGDFFGHRALLNDEVRQATVIAKSDVTCLILERQDFVSMLGNFEDFQNRVVSNDAEETRRERTLVQNKHMRDIRFEDLEKFFERGSKQSEVILGQGAFGMVQIVKHKTTGETYALKTLSKSLIVEYGLESHVVDERKVMHSVDHPSLLKMFNSYWDEKCVYFLLELCLGGELFTILRRSYRFKERQAKFYSASVVQGLAHMHEKNIAYRDLKPENLVLDEKGFLKIIDFGLAKVIKNRSWTLCGTPDYLAPEIITSSGHDKAVDYWALGILVFELMVGNTPFYAEDPLAAYKRILNTEPNLPSLLSRPARSLITKLLKKDQLKRLGNTIEGVQAIFHHIWFSGFDWDALERREMAAPFVPKVEDKEDTSNFDKVDVDFSSQRCAWQPDFPYKLVDGITQAAT